MLTLWDKFWNDENFALRIMRGLAMGLGAFIIAGGVAAWVSPEMGAGLIAIASMFSGGASKNGSSSASKAAPVALVLILGVVLLFAGCQQTSALRIAYDGATVESLADQFEGATTLSMEECIAFHEAARALRDDSGGDTAWYVPLGKAQAIREASKILDRQGARCTAALEMALDVEQADVLGRIFTATWFDARRTATHP